MLSPGAFRWLSTLAGTVILGGIAWFFAPLLPVFAAPQPREGLLLLLFAAWGAGNLSIEQRRRRRDRRLAAALTGGEAEAEEAAALRRKLAEAITLLKSTRGGRGHLYQQPWYMIIGPPGAGKTTALLNAGLSFPLAETMGRDPLAGVGGTRFCEWWFTDDAVLIDTAGRYTTQDSDARVDRAGWSAFLDALRTTRKRQPLNGIIIALAVTDIAYGPADARQAHARAVRQRVAELAEHFGNGLPLYVLFTKLDLLAGFAEFFGDLDSEGRAQVWGATFPLNVSYSRKPPPLFSEEFRRLSKRLSDRLFDRLQTEPSVRRRALISGFSAQFASLHMPLAAFFAEAFAADEAGHAPCVRGFYFTSATQEGTPLDRLTGMLRVTFGLNEQPAGGNRPEHGRAYFIKRLLQNVIFSEAMLMSAPPAKRRMRRLARSSAVAAILLLAAAAGAYLANQRRSVQGDIAEAADRVGNYESDIASVTFDPVSEGELGQLAPLLDKAAALAKTTVADSQTIYPDLHLLAQEEKLGSGERAIYRRMLVYAFLPRLVWRLEAQMHGSLGRPEFLYEALRVYLTLGSRGPLDRALVMEWMALDWETAFTAPEQARLRESLQRHLAALLAEPLPPVPLDGDLVAQARATFRQVTLAQRVYSRIRLSAAAQRTEPWRPSDALGAAGVKVFVRASGRPLTEGVPGFYTKDGFHRVLMPALGHAAQDVASESWVLGERLTLEPGSPQMRAVEHDVAALYAADYVRAWEAMLADLDLAPLRSLTQAAEGLYVISSPYSPMRSLLVAAAGQLSLASPLPSVSAASGEDRADGLRQRLGGTFAGDAAAVDVRPEAPGHEVDDRFKPLRDLVGAAGGGPIDQALKPLVDLQQQLARLAASGQGGAMTVAGTAGGVADPVAALRVEALRQPQPLARWLSAAAASGLALRSGDPRQQIIAVFNGVGGPAALCPQVAGRFPFAPAGPDVALEEFARLFGPGGALDGFFNTQLKPFVDVSGRQWRLQTVNGVAAPFMANDLAQFQRAAAIRDTFFPGGSGLPLVRFEVTPVKLEGGTARAILELDGTALPYAGGRSRSVQMTWPVAGRAQGARVVFDPPSAAGSPVLEESGPWALFRLMRRGRLQPAGAPDRLTVTWQSGERLAAYDVRASGMANPFIPALLQDFRCPSMQ